MAKNVVKLGSNTIIEFKQRGEGDFAWFTICQGKNFSQTETTKAELIDLREALDRFLREVGLER